MPISETQPFSSGQPLFQNSGAAQIDVFYKMLLLFIRLFWSISRPTDDLSQAGRLFFSNILQEVRGFPWKLFFNPYVFL